MRHWSKKCFFLCVQTGFVNQMFGDFVKISNFTDSSHAIAAWDAEFSRFCLAIINIPPTKQISAVATSPLALRWVCDSPRTGCARTTTIYIYIWTNNNRVIAAHDLYCCLLPQCEALRTCRSGFSDRNSARTPGHWKNRWSSSRCLSAVA